MNGNLKAFVLMPFDPEFNSIYEDLIKSALEAAGYDVARADSFFDQQSILRDIVRGIAEADLIVADLTTLNPNVLYELGLCHGLGIPTILLAQSVEEIPFDLRGYRIHSCSTQFDEVHKLKHTLKETGEKHKLGGITFGSPITDFLPPETPALRRKSTRRLPEKLVEEKSKEGELEETEEEKGFLDFLVEGSKAAEEITVIISDITQETVNIGEKFKSHTAKLQALRGSSGPGIAVQARKIALIAAENMNSYSKRIDENLPRLENSIDVLSESFSRYVAWIEPKSDEDRKQFADFRQVVAGLLEGTKAGLVSMSAYRDTVAHLRGISRDVNQASRRLTRALDGIISAMDKIEAFCVRTLPLIDEKLEKRFESDSTNT